MKILFLSDDFPPRAKGGAGIVASSLARELARRGHAVTVITAVQDHSLVGSFHEDGMRVERVYSDYAPRWRSWLSLYNPVTVGRVKEILTQVKPDVVHAHNVHYHLSYWSLHLAKRSGAKVFLTAHDVMLFHYGKLVEFVDLEHPKCKKKWNYKVSAWRQFKEYRFWYNPFRNIAIRLLLGNVDHIFAVSAALKDALEQNGITNVEIMHNGIDVAAWKISQGVIDRLEENLGLIGKKVVLLGGRISALKGGNVAFGALREITRTEPDAILLVLGTRDAFVESLSREARERGIADCIVSTGWLSGDELRAAYHAADVIVVPSLYLDPLPTVILEAMACGKPVVGSCLGGIPEIIADGETGRVINPYDAVEFAAAIQELIGDEQKRVRFGRTGLARVEQLFSLGKWCDRTLAAYTKAP